MPGSERLSESVELVEEIERTFGVALDDQACERVLTVQDLCDLVFATVPHAQQDRCLTALSFWRLRRALVSSLGVEPAIIRPKALVETLLWPGKKPSYRERRDTWRRLELSLGCELRALERPAWLVWTCTALCLAGLVAGLLRAADSTERWIATGLTVVVAMGLGVLTRPFRVLLPGEGVTVRALAGAILLHHAGKIAAPAGGFTRAQVEDLVPRIVSDQLGIPLYEVVPDAQFVKDFGID